MNFCPFSAASSRDAYPYGLSRLFCGAGFFIVLQLVEEGAAGEVAQDIHCGVDIVRDGHGVDKETHDARGQSGHRDKRGEGRDAAVRDGGRSDGKENVRDAEGDDLSD